MSTLPSLPNSELLAARKIRLGKEDVQRLGVADKTPAKVYNLTVLVRASSNALVHARAANLALPEIEAATIREALQQLTNLAKASIEQSLANSTDIPWIETPREPSDTESRFVVPLHL